MGQKPEKDYNLCIKLATKLIVHPLWQVCSNASACYVKNFQRPKREGSVAFMIQKLRPTILRVMTVTMKTPQALRKSLSDVCAWRPTWLRIQPLQEPGRGATSVSMAFDHLRVVNLNTPQSLKSFPRCWPAGNYNAHRSYPDGNSAGASIS